ncbi:MAG: 50S ribosomal protein L24 [Chloroflexi bacterium]|jgi:large subunit ribosomal protein L24|nr:MAG: 50S ribosomal protein L24 [Chloroflexota bacterium]
MSRLHLDIHRDDTVQVMSGKDRGKRGVVVRTVPQQGKIVVKGVNILKRHTRAGQQKGSTTVRQGGIVDFESPLDYSNVMLVCNKCDKPTRIRKTVLPNGQKAIVCVNCGEIYERVRNKI